MILGPFCIRSCVHAYRICTSIYIHMSAAAHALYSSAGPIHQEDP